MRQKQIQKNIRFPQRVVELIEEEGMSKFGFSFSKYVQYLILKEAEEIMQVEEEVLNDPQLVEDIILARKMSKEGKLPTVRTKKEIEDYINSL
jgi:hypothetical protein